MNDSNAAGNASPGAGNQTCIIKPVVFPTTGQPHVGTVPMGTPWVQPGVGYPPPGDFVPYPAQPLPGASPFPPVSPEEQEKAKRVMDELAKRVAAAKKDKAMLGDSGYERIEADLYQTPPENVDVLFEFFQPVSHLIWEPACGEGYIAKRIMELGYETWSSDLHDYGWGTPNTDFLLTTKMPNPNIRTIVTNPPYDELAEQFIRHALKLTEPVKGQVVMFLRNEFDCGKGRMDLFGKPPFHAKIVVTKRPRWIAGSKGSPRHNYSWFIWDWRHVRGPAATYYQHPSFAKPLRAHQ